MVAAPVGAKSTPVKKELSKDLGK
jgi:hypothetical protein